MIIPNAKLRIFISSICGVDKYDVLRKKLKNAIEETQLADVYIFEAEEASTLSAKNHYRWKLQDSDLCIFLIDNEDGITSGVQEEIDTVNKFNIKALYYFCDETNKKKTILEKKLEGAHNVKKKTVHSFDELYQNSSKGLIDDIVNIYHYYCKGKFIVAPEQYEEIQNIDINKMEKSITMIPKLALQDVDKCCAYISNLIVGTSMNEDKDIKSNVLDNWGAQFLEILLDGKAIKQFDVEMYMNDLKEQQDEEYNQLVYIRWQAIQSYFSGNIEQCIKNLKNALDFAKDKKQPDWVIKDILVDLRNQYNTYCVTKNRYSTNIFQRELKGSEKYLFYPILDRINESLHEKYTDEFYKIKTKSPYSVKIGNNLDEYGKLIASLLIVAMYNGSLTHVLRIYKTLKEFTYFLSCNYSDWNIRFALYKFAIFEGIRKDVKSIEDSYSEILNNISADEAKSIMLFCQNHPIKYKRLNSQLIAFGSIGYFLNDEDFRFFESYLINEINLWIDRDYNTVTFGQNLFYALSGVSHRMSQKIFGEICCKLIDKHYVHWYRDMFKFIANSVDLRKMDKDIAIKFIEHINSIFDHEKDRELIKFDSRFIFVLRNQDRVLTNALDNSIEKYYPELYKGEYKVATTKDGDKNIYNFIEQCVERIHRHIEMQEHSGIAIEYGSNDILILKSILDESRNYCENKTIDNIIQEMGRLLLIPNELISNKLDAISLLMLIFVKYKEDYSRNIDIYEKLFEKRKEIQADDNQLMSFNVSDVAMKIGLQVLFSGMEKDVYDEFTVSMSCIQGNTATTIEVTKLIREYLNMDDTLGLPEGVEIIILQNVLQWLHSDSLDIRWNATSILMALSRDHKNQEIVNNQLVRRIDEENAYIKCLIIRNLNKFNGITEETKKYIMSKCQNDAHYVVRMVCEEIGFRNQTTELKR